MWSWLSGHVFAAVLVTAAQAETVTVAAAANFRKPLDEIAARFSAATGHEVVVSVGSSGQLYAQIANGAPFDVFLSADQARPSQAVAAGLAVPGSQRTYAAGRLILIFRDEETAVRVGTPPDLSQIGTLAIANPATAPYGVAAVQVIEKLGAKDTLAGRIAEAQNVSGVNAAVETGAAEAGFAALSSVSEPAAPEPRGWPVPDDLHDPIRQDAVVLERGRDNPAAAAFHDYLFGGEAAGVIRAYGYDVP
jgi:molybdate transport system substrate-binding protein